MISIGGIRDSQEPPWNRRGAEKRRGRREEKEQCFVAKARRRREVREQMRRKKKSTGWKPVLFLPRKILSFFFSRDLSAPSRLCVKEFSSLRSRRLGGS
jgi:hypothetical protein